MAFGVILGAFGAHGLKHRLSEPDLAIYQTAVFYLLVHGLAIMAASGVGILLKRESALRKVCCLFLFAIIVFCGSLFLLVLTDTRWLGAITPIGGAGFIASWSWLGWICFSSARKVNEASS